MTSLATDSSLREAAAAGDLPQVEAFVSRLPEDDPESAEDDIAWGLVEAINHQQIEVVRYLLAKGAEAHPHSFKSALQTNAPNEILQALLDHGVDVNAEVGDHRLVHFAVGSERQLQFMLDRGADPNPRDRKWNQTPLDIVAGHYSLEIFRLLLSRGAKLEHANPMRNAAVSSTEDDRIPIMQYLVDECHVDINAMSTVGSRRVKKRGDEDCTPLQSAVNRGRRDRIEFLLSRGADPNAKSSCGEDAFEYAQRHELAEGLKVLKECLAARSLA